MEGFVVDGGFVDVGFGRGDWSFNEEFIAADADDATVGADVLLARIKKKTIDFYQL